MAYARLLDELQSGKPVHIYGAGVIAYGMYKALLTVHKIRPIDFVVSEQKGNAKCIEGIPVKLVGDMPEYVKTDLVIVAVPEIYHEEIRGILEDEGWKCCIFVDSNLEYLVMSEYFKKEWKLRMIEQEEEIESGQKEASLCFYMAACHKDIMLKKKYTIPGWCKVVQAGADLTDLDITELKDNTGNHISFKNHNYSELTVTYWVWKNRTEDYVGIGHYRRMLLLRDSDIRRMASNHIDAILPLPFVCYPNTSQQFSRYISSEDMEVLQEAFKALQCREMKSIEAILNGNLLYNYNMLIARQEVFDSYCSWMFPVLLKVEQIWEERDVVRTDRYLGYIGEVLTSLYFMLNQNRLKIVHVQKVWMV